MFREYFSNKKHDIVFGEAGICVLKSNYRVYVKKIVPYIARFENSDLVASGNVLNVPL